MKPGKEITIDQSQLIVKEKPADFACSTNTELEVANAFRRRALALHFGNSRNLLVSTSMYSLESFTPQLKDPAVVPSARRCTTCVLLCSYMRKSGFHDSFCKMGSYTMSWYWSDPATHPHLRNLLNYFQKIRQLLGLVCRRLCGLRLLQTSSCLT